MPYVSSFSHNSYYRDTRQMERKVLYVCLRNFIRALRERDNNKYLLGQIIVTFCTINLDFLKLTWCKYYRTNIGAIYGIVVRKA